MKTLISGTTGFLGKIIYDHLIRNNDDIIVKSINRNKGDYIFDLANNHDLINEYFDLIIHTAGKAHLAPSNQHDIDDFYNINYYGTINLLNSLSNNPPTNFVFISSVAVYGKNEGIRLNEDTPLNATDPYGKSKILAENAVIEWCNKYNVKFTIFRLPLVVGSAAPGNLSAMIYGIKKGYYFNVGGGNSKKSMVLADDIPKFILKASNIGGIYNLTDDYHPSFKELSLLISKQLGKSNPYNIPSNIALILAKFGDCLGNKAPINSIKLKKLTSTLTFDDTKAKLAFGWTPTPVLEGFKLL